MGFTEPLECISQVVKLFLGRAAYDDDVIQVYQEGMVGYASQDGLHFPFESVGVLQRPKDINLNSTALDLWRFCLLIVFGVQDHLLVATLRVRCVEPLSSCKRVQGVMIL
jgi:hypothetical protein